jgi:MFS family permease
VRSESPESGYAALFGVRGLSHLIVSLTLGRIAGQMQAIALVLFVLSRYHSPQLAGAATFISMFPGILLSPVAGALLDRYGRARLVTIDYGVVAGTLSLVAGLSTLHALPPTLLLAICGAASLTAPLSAAGARSLFPTLVPSHLWERANALDNTSMVLGYVVGAPFAGILVGLAGGEGALEATALVYMCAAIAIATVGTPGSKQTGANVLEEAWSGLTYVLRNRTLVGLALTFFSFNIGWGCLVITIPVLVLGRFHEGPAVVGYIWGAFAAAGVVVSLLSGRIHTNGRERQLMSVSLAAIAVAMVFVPLAGSVIVVAAALVAMAIVEGPFDIAFLTLRQRRTDPAQFGRMLAVSMSLNSVGYPIGSALAGVLIPRSMTLTLWGAVLAVLTAALLPMLAIPARDGP